MATPAPKQPQKIDAPEELMELSDWWQKNGNICSTILLVIALGIFGYRFWDGHQKKVAAQASAALAESRSAEDFEKVATEFPSSGDAPLALLMSASEYCRKGDADSIAVAREKYTAFLKKHSRHELAPVAKLGIAFTDEAAGSFDAALKGYEDFLGSVDADNYLAPVATLGKARCLALQGKADEARTILDQMTAEKSNTLWAVQADELKSNLSQMKFTKPAAFGDILGDALSSKAKEAEEAAPAVEETPAPAAEEAAAPAAEPAAPEAPAAE